LLAHPHQNVEHVARFGGTHRATCQFDFGKPQSGSSGEYASARRGFGLRTSASSERFRTKTRSLLGRTVDIDLHGFADALLLGRRGPEAFRSLGNIDR
jgi:hypothetical protein